VRTNSGFLKILPDSAPWLLPFLLSIVSIRLQLVKTRHLNSRSDARVPFTNAKDEVLTPIP
jgi:hypothetical protein